MRLQIEVAGKTDVGIVRKNNEDNYGFDTRLGVFVLCDGMGGQAAGEVASRLAIESVLNYFRTAERTGSFPIVGGSDERASQLGNAVLSSIRLANTAVWEAAVNNANQTGMGSTLVLAAVRDSIISIGHVGDSRAYLLRNGELRQLTEDHSLIMEQVRHGQITAEEAERSPFQNIIMRALGAADTVTPDTQDLIATKDDLVLLACDGLTKVVSNAQMQSILTQETDLGATADLLIQTAKQNQSDDNITCVLIRFKQRPWYTLLSRTKHHSQGPL
jgi:protein phosphatase